MEVAMRGVALVAWMWLWGCIVAPATGIAAPPATTRPAPPRTVRWHSSQQPAAAEARKTGRLLVVVFHDPTHPASQAFEEMTLSDPATREFLADFIAVRLDATKGEGKRRLEKLKLGEAPLTCVYSPQGQLLDSIPGCIIPAGRFCQRLARSAAYWRAATSRPFDPAARWRAVQARLKLSTRAQAAAEIDKLLKLPTEKLPKDVTPAKLHLAKGMALLRSAPKQAEAHLNKARSLAAGDADTSAQALLTLAELYDRTGRTKAAHELYGLYIARFPRAGEVGRAYCAKAVLEWVGLNDQNRARKTLREFLSRYPDDTHAIRARGMLEMIGRGKAKDSKE
ncbi:MAG: hypothetical protein B1H04_01865 [Planctomycetales bacterium 4484_123]|nr:MAG: hypothetical protein B1H04_01865 [Planctomycetales bacterium 4484_123]